jgi:hypothetical protein
MRAPVTEPRLREFMRAIAAAAAEPGRIYLTGGATAVLRGWRDSTVDIDIKLVPDSDRILRAIPNLKESLHINVELASPADFLPELPGWQERSPFIAHEGTLDFFHYDFYSQCLSKLERDHRKDREDVHAMLVEKLVEPARLRELFERIEDQLYRFPAVNSAGLRAAVTELQYPRS